MWPQKSSTMKKILLTFFAAMLVFSGCNKSKQFKVTLNLDNADNQTVYLFKTVGGNDVIVDSAVFADKTAVLTADADDPQTPYMIKFAKDERCGIFPFFTENQNTTIIGSNMDEMQHWTVKGCPTMDVYNAYRESLEPYEEQIMAVFDGMNNAAMTGDTVKAAEMQEELYAKMDEYHNVICDFIRSHSDSYISHFMLDQTKELFDIEVVKELVEGFTTESAYKKKIQEYIKQNL